MDGEEQWKNINFEPYSDVYEASTSGYIRRISSQNILKYCLRVGYPSVSLSKNNNKITVNIHRIIALTFLPNPDNLPIINHKNGDRTDNSVENLEWMSYKSNTAHALETKLAKPSTKKVYQYSKDGLTLINTFDSIREAEKSTLVGNRSISQTCRTQRATAGGYIWKYVDGFEYVKETDVEGIVVKDFPNYKITEDGKIYSIRSKRYLILNPSGDYNSIKLCNKGVQQDFYIHVLVATYHIPNPHNYTVVNHINADKHDNRKENLEWTTSSGNMKHHIKTRQPKTKV